MATYYGFVPADDDLQYRRYSPAPPSPDPSQPYTPSYSDPYSSGDAYSTGQYAPAGVWSEPSPDPYTAPPPADPYLDPGYTLDQGYRPPQESAYSLEAPPADYVTMPGEDQAYNPSTGEYWQPDTYRTSDTAWLAPTVDESRNPEPPPPTIEQTAAPVDPRRSGHRYDAAQYLMENVYSTGEHAPAGVWGEPASTAPDTQSEARQANQQAAAENAAYEANQYAAGNVFSTNAMGPGQDFNPAAWDTSLAASMGPPEPVEPIYSAPGRPAAQPDPTLPPYDPSTSTAPGFDGYSTGVDQGGLWHAFRADDPGAEMTRVQAERAAQIAERDRQAGALAHIQAREEALAAGLPLPAGTPLGPTNPLLASGKRTEPNIFERIGQTRDRVGGHLGENVVDPALGALDTFTRPARDAIGGRLTTATEPLGEAAGDAISQMRPSDDFRQTADSYGRFGQALTAVPGAAAGFAGETLDRGTATTRQSMLPVAETLAQAPDDMPLVGGIGNVSARLAEGDIGGAIMAGLDAPAEWSRRWQSEMMLAAARGDYDRIETLGEWANKVATINGFTETFQVPILRAIEGDDAYRALIISTYETAEAAGQNGFDALWELYQADRSLLQRGFADVAVDPYSWPIAGAGLAGQVARGGRLMQTARNPVVRQVGGWVENLGEGAATVLGSADAAADLGLSDAALSAGGAVGRRVRSLTGGLLDPTEESAKRAAADQAEDLATSGAAALRNAGGSSAPPAGSAGPAGGGSGTGGGNAPLPSIIPAAPASGTIPPPPTHLAQPASTSFVSTSSVTPVPPAGGAPAPGATGTATGAATEIRSDQFTNLNSSRERRGKWLLIQNNDGEVIVTTADRSRLITPRPLTMEQAESVVDELRAGATELEAATWGERMRTGWTPTDADGGASTLPDAAEGGTDARRTPPAGDLDGLIEPEPGTLPEPPTHLAGEPPPPDADIPGVPRFPEATGESAVDPALQRTPGEGDVPPGDLVRRIVPEVDAGAVREAESEVRTTRRRLQRAQSALQAFETEIGTTNPTGRRDRVDHERLLLEVEAAQGKHEIALEELDRLTRPPAEMQRTPGITQDVPAGGMRTTLPEAELQPGRATQQPAPVANDGITAPLADPDTARLRNAQQLTERADELQDTLRAAETGQPVDLPDVPPEPFAGPTPRQTPAEGPAARRTDPAGDLARLESPAAEPVGPTNMGPITDPEQVPVGPASPLAQAPELTEQLVGDGSIRVIGDGSSFGVYRTNQAGDLERVGPAYPSERQAQRMARQEAAGVNAAARPPLRVQEGVTGDTFDVIDPRTGEIVVTDARNRAEAEYYARHSWPGEPFYGARTANGRQVPGNQKHHQSLWVRAKRAAVADDNADAGAQVFIEDAVSRFGAREAHLTRNGTYNTKTSGGNAWKTADQNAERFRAAFEAQRQRGFPVPAANGRDRVRLDLARKARARRTSHLAPPRFNDAGEALSDADWTPSTNVPRWKDARQGDPNVPWVNWRPNQPREASWVVNEHPVTPEDAQRTLNEFLSTRMTTQRFDSPNGRQNWMMLYDHNLFDYTPQVHQAYENFLNIVGPLIRKEPDAWEVIAARGEFPETAIDHARRLANGETLDSIMADVADREAAAGTLRPLTAQTVEHGVGDDIVDAVFSDLPRSTSRRTNRRTKPAPGSPSAAHIAILPEVRARALHDRTEWYRRSGRDSFILKTANAAADRTPGYWSRTTGAILTDAEEAFFSTKLTKTRGRLVGELLIEYQDDMSRGRALANRNPATLTPKEREDLAAIERKFDLPLSGISDTRADELVAARVRTRYEIEQGTRTSTGAPVPPQRTWLGKTVDAYLAFRRKMSLYNPLGGPSYVMLNLVGNLITAGIARPTAIGDYLKAIGPAIPKQIGLDVETWADTMRRNTGLGRTNLLTNVNRDQLQHGRNLFATPAGSFFGKATGMQLIRDLAVAIDSSLRDAVYRDVAEKALVKMKLELEDHAFSLTDTWIGRGRGVNVAPEDVANAIRALQFRGQFSADDVRRAVLDLIPDENLHSADFRNLADRLGRDWKEGLRAMDAVAAQEVNRVAFDGAMTNLDNAISRVFMFHYWASRASALYTREALRKPYLINAYLGLQDWIEKNAEQNNVPDWLNNTIELAKSPAGFITFMNLGAWFGTMTTMTDTDGGSEGDSRQLTGLGAYLDHGVSTGNGLLDMVVNAPANTMLNPIIENLLYVSGALGTDARPGDLLGTRPFERGAVDLANSIMANGGIFVDLPVVGRVGWEMEGAPERVRELDSRQVFNQLAQFFSGERGNGVTQAVAPWNPDATAQSQFQKLMMGVARSQNPDATQAELNEIVEDALHDPEHDLYGDTLQAWAAEPWTGWGAPDDWPDWARQVASTVTRLAVGRSIYQRVTEGERERDMEDPDERRANELFYSPNAETLAVDQAVDAYYDIGRGEAGQLPQTAEQAGRVYANGYNAIRDGAVKNPFRVGSTTYTPEMVAAMTPEQRADLAQAWMNQYDDSWDQRDAYYQARDAFLSEHPEAEGALAIRQIADDYPGGREMWIRDTRQINAPYDAFMTELEQRYPPGSEEWLKYGTSGDAALAINGEPTSPYDVYPDERGRYQAAGTNGLSLDAYAAQRRQDADAERQANAAGNESEFIATAREDLQKINAVVTRLDELDAYYGLAPGTSRNAYMARLLGNNKSYVPNVVYEAARAEFGSIYPTENGGAEKYLAWLNTNPVDPSFEAWEEQSWAEYQQRQAALEARMVEDFDPASLLGQQSPVRTTDPNMVGNLPRENAVATATPQAQPVTANPSPYQGRGVTPNVEAVNARVAPGMNAPILAEMPAGAPMRVLGEQTVDGVPWLQVELPGGYQAWVRADLLFFTD